MNRRTLFKRILGALGLGAAAATSEAKEPMTFSRILGPDEPVYTTELWPNRPSLAQLASKRRLCVETGNPVSVHYDVDNEMWHVLDTKREEEEVGPKFMLKENDCGQLVIGTDRPWSGLISCNAANTSLALCGRRVRTDVFPTDHVLAHIKVEDEEERIEQRGPWIHKRDATLCYACHLKLGLDPAMPDPTCCSLVRYSFEGKPLEHSFLYHAVSGWYTEEVRGVHPAINGGWIMKTHRPDPMEVAKIGERLAQAISDCIAAGWLKPAVDAGYFGLRRL